jgi:hypothetical protein
VTAGSSIDPAEFLHEHLAQASPDLLRELMQGFINTLLSADADSLCGAAYRARGAGRINRRNGYRRRDQTKELRRWLEDQVEQLGALLTHGPRESVRQHLPQRANHRRRAPAPLGGEAAGVLPCDQLEQRTLRGNGSLVVVEGDVPCAARASSTWS